MNQTTIKGIVVGSVAVICAAMVWMKSDLGAGDNASPEPRTGPPLPEAGMAPSGEISPDTAGPSTSSDDPVVEVAISGNATGLPGTIAQMLRSGNQEGRDRVFAELLPTLMDNDIGAAGNLASALPSWAWREEVVGQVARVWAGKDPDAAAEWAARFQVIPERLSALTNVCIQVAQDDPARAVQLAEEYRLTTGESVVAENLVQLWAARDFPSATEWANQQPPGLSRDKVFARLALVKAERSPEEAARLVVENITSGSVQTEAAMSVLHQWAIRDAVAAEAWVKLFPPGDFRTRAEDELAGVAKYAQPPGPPGS